jgi:hypothetical protein
MVRPNQAPHDLTATAGLTAGHANSRGRFSMRSRSENAAMAADRVDPGRTGCKASAQFRKKEGRGMPDDGFIDELRSTLDQGSVLCGAEIDARYHHDLAGNPVPKPRAVVRPRTTAEVSARGSVIVTACP